MNKLLKSISISLTGVIVMMLLIGCTPGKAQTRGNDYKGSFQNEEFEEFSADNANDDTIPPMNRGKDQNSKNKYAENGYKPRVKSGSETYEQDNRDYKETKNRYSDTENEGYSNAYGKGGYEDETENADGGQDKFFQIGTASWYGREFHGKTTASGDRFDMNELTAAHKTLPFGTIVEVKNMENGKAVRLKINDRGPYRGNRIIDLSFAGAREIGMIKSGEANVGIKVLKMGSTKTADSSREKRYVEPVADDEPYASVKSEREDEYYEGVKLQAGAFYSRKNAENLKSKIEGMTERPVKIIKEGDFFKVRVEGMRDRKEMGRLKNMLSEDNISSFGVE